MLDAQPGFMVQLNEVYSGKVAKRASIEKWKQKSHVCNRVSTRTALRITVCLLLYA
jgi:hypothetical protein